MKRWPVIAGGSLLALVAAFVAGRYSAPARVVEKEKVTERKVVDSEAIAQAVAFARAEWKRDVSDHTVTRTIYRDGKPSERIVYVDRETQSAGSSQAASTVYVDRVVHETTDRMVEKERIVEGARPGWRLAATAGWGPDLTLRPSVYGVEVDRRLFGTIWLGAWGRTDKTAGLALALEW